MNLTKLLLPILSAATLAATSCVVPAPGPYVGPGPAPVAYAPGGYVEPVGYATYETLPVGFYGDYYFVGGHYYCGGRYLSGRCYHNGHYYSGRYFHNGHYYYGGRYGHHHR